LIAPAQLAAILPFLGPIRRNIARDNCKIYRELRVIRSRIQGFRP
jgi:hypothetical protein